jgi:Cysteine-rich CWC
MTEPADPTRCPLCDGPNDCQSAAGRSTCWCFETPVPPAVLARVPKPLRGVACVCKSCASGQVSAGRIARALRWTRR